MNDWIASLGLSALKPLIASLLLPPLPMLLLVLLGALWLRRRPALGWAGVLLGLGSLWAACTPWGSEALLQGLTRPPPALTAAQRQALTGAPHTAIVVLGGGRRQMAPEYGEADLTPMSAERLRYGLWLARQTGLPVAFSGGVGHGARPGSSEAEVAALYARRHTGQALRWAEARSRDTAENARLTLALLARDGVRTVVLVTHGFHQQRALAAFQREAGRAGLALTLVPAPMDVRLRGPGLTLSDVLPYDLGLATSRWAVHEWLGWLGGA